MSVLLELDNRMEKEVNRLKKHFPVNSTAEFVKTGIALLKFVCQLEQEGRKIVAKKGDEERRIVFK